MNRKYNSKLPDRSSLDFILIFHHMKTGYGLLYGMFFLLNACGQPEPREEMYDFIITTEYRNSYDAAGKLSSVNISERNEQNVNGKYMLKDSKHTVQKYKYPEGAICQISTTSDYSPDDVHISVTGEKSDEDYTVRNGSDTLYYDLSVYLDKEKTKLKYRRYIWKGVASAAGSYGKDENTESTYDYDDKGNNTRIIKRDFITRDSIETFIFYNIPYKEAVKLAPGRKNTQVVCCLEKEAGDTTVTNYLVNGETTACYKKYKDGDKTVEARYDADSLLVEKNTGYKEGEFDITVKQISEFELTDTTYCMAGKKIRKVSVYPDSKSVTTSEYDDRGNVVKEVRKSKISLTKENVNELLRVIQELKKD